jgi:hypothetical protein
MSLTVETMNDVNDDAAQRPAADGERAAWNRSNGKHKAWNAACPSGLAGTLVLPGRL